MRQVAQRSQRVLPKQRLRYEQLCGQPTVSSPPRAYPLHELGSSAAPTATFAIAAQWLFMHLPSTFSSKAISACAKPPELRRTNVSGTLVPGRPVPFIMGHMAGVRTGAWSRRAILRAYGWWSAAADQLVAAEFKWRGLGAPVVQLQVPPEATARRADDAASSAASASAATSPSSADDSAAYTPLSCRLL